MQALHVSVVPKAVSQEIQNRSRTTGDYQVDVGVQQKFASEADLGQRRLRAGQHILRLECTGKGGATSGTKLGIDSVRLRRRWNVKRQTPKGW